MFDKQIHQNVFTQNRVIKNTMIHKPKVKLKKIIKNWERERERERVLIFSGKHVRENKNLQKIRWKNKKNLETHVVINTQLSKSCYMIK